MISSKLFRFKGALNVLQHQLKYNFVSFPTKKDKRMLKLNIIPQYHRDDLLLPQSDQYEGIEKIVEYVKRTDDAELRPVNIALLLYHCGKEDICEPLVVEGIERTLAKYTGHFRPRWAFGALYGAYRTNAGSLKVLEFFENEFLTNIAEISRTEAVELVEALSYSKQLSKTRKFNFVKEHLQPLMLNNWKKLQYQIKYLLILFRAIVRLEYYDQELCDTLFQALQSRKNLKQFHLVLELYQTFQTLEKSGKFYRELTGEIDHFRNLLLKKEDLTWRYNIEENRFYTYAELKSVREDFQYADQYLSFTDPKLSAEDEQLRLEQEQKEEEEREKEERDARLNEIVRDRYMSMLRGDIGMEELEGNVVMDEREAEAMKNSEETPEEEEEEEELKNRKKGKPKQQKSKGKGKIRHDDPALAESLNRDED